MTPKIETMLEYYVVKKEHRKYRQEKKDAYRYAGEYADRKSTRLNSSHT